MLKAENRAETLDVQRRAHRRTAYLEQCFLQTDTRSLWAKSINLSDNGMCVVVKEFGILKRDTKVTAFVQNFEPIDGTVRWTRGNVAGLDFSTPAYQHPQINALLQRLLNGGEAWLPIAPLTVDDKLPRSLREILQPDPAQDAPIAVPQNQAQDPAKRRIKKRIHYTEPCLLKTDKRTFQASAINISEDGMSLRLRGLGNMRVGAALQVILDGGYPPIDATTRWSKEREIGVQFQHSIKGHPVLRSATESASN